MNNLAHKLQTRQVRKHRNRTTVSGTAARPRLSVHVSLQHVNAQIIDDTTGKTLAAASTVGAKEAKGNLTAKAEWVGEQIAKKAKAAKVKSVVFDRSGRKYHGRVKALADAARKEGLEF